MNENQNTDWRGALERQEFLLKQIAESQTELLAVEKQRLRTEHYKIIAQTLKFVVVLILIWFGFSQIKSFATSLWSRNSIVESAMVPAQAQDVLGGLGEITKILGY